jgi:hypothetical protein
MYKSLLIYKQLVGVELHYTDYTNYQNYLQEK